ncbi:MAG: hypothetical protein NVSMB2_20640 [Chloroflexota bacterium]
MSSSSPLDGLVNAVTERVLQSLASGGQATSVTPDAGRLPQGYTSGGVFADIPLHDELAIAGVELTQSTQYNSSVSGGYGPENGVPLVALKTLVARAYPVVRQGVLTHGLAGLRVTGELTVSVGDRVLYRTGPTRSHGARLGSPRELDRTLWDQELTFPVASGAGVLQEHKLQTLDCSLNFIVPAYYCPAGRVVVSVAIWPILADGGRGASSAWWSRVDFVDVAAPRLCLVRVNWTDSAGNTSTPPAKNMLNTLSLAMRMMPFPYFETTILSTDLNSSATFAAGATSAGSCNPAWDRLVADLAVTGIFTALFGLGDIVVGFVPSAALPAGASVVVGCGRGGLGVFVDQPITFAHEFGHMYRRQHVAVPGDPNNDTAYPNYGGSTRSIGEVGLDSGTFPPTVFDPSTSVDIMAYPANSESQWISPYTYQAIFDGRGMHQTAPASPARVRPRLILSVRLDRAGAVIVKRALRVDAAGDVTRQWAGATSPLSVDVLDAQGAILLTHHMLYAPPRGCGSGSGCGCGEPVPTGREPWLDMDEVLEWPTGAAAVAFHTGETAIHTLRVGEAPHLDVSPPERHDGRIRFSVGAQHPREAATIAILFTGDDGVTWWPIAVDPPRGQVDVADNCLPSRGHSRFRIIATAELQATVVDTAPIDLSPTPRRAYIVAPDESCAVPSGPIQLTALLDLNGHPMPQARDLRWRSDVEGDLGSGFAITPSLRRGRHEVSVIGSNGIGGTFQDRAIIIVGG